MFSRSCSVVIILPALFALLSCSHGDPLNPDPLADNVSSDHQAQCRRQPWGLWEFRCDPVDGSVEAVPLRGAMFNANVVRFLQPPSSPANLITVAPGPGGDPSNGYWVLDITFRHPFIGASKFRGFDVRGIIMAEGDVASIHDPTATYHATDGTRLLNPDGYTRWWNQQEFTTYGTVLGYTEGVKAIPGFESTSTVNPYKLFTDALDEEAPVNSMNADLRASFATRPGVNTRRYKIQFDLDGSPPIRFKYAVDASWSLPDSAYAPEYPIEAFDLSANCQELYLLRDLYFEEIPYFEDESTYGGDAVFFLGIGDWQATSADNVLDQLSHLWIESPTLIDEPIDALPLLELISSNHFTQGVYRLAIEGCHPTGLADQYFFITAESAHPDSYMPQIEGDPYMFDWPDAPLAAHNIVQVPINPEAPPQPTDHWVVGLPDWCALTEHCTDGADNLQLVTNLVTWDLEGPYNDNLVVKWWEGHVTPSPPYSTYIIENHIATLGYMFRRTNEAIFDPTECRMIIVNFVTSPGGRTLPFTEDEVQGMKDFVAGGGILCFLIENPTYCDPTHFETLMDSLEVPLGYGGQAEPPSTTTLTTDITDHYLTTGVNSFQYWTCGEFILESEECVSLVRSWFGEHIVPVAPIDVG